MIFCFPSTICCFNWMGYCIARMLLCPPSMASCPSWMIFCPSSMALCPSSMTFCPGNLFIEHLQPPFRVRQTLVKLNQTVSSIQNEHVQHLLPHVRAIQHCWSFWQNILLLQLSNNSAQLANEYRWKVNVQERNTIGHLIVNPDQHLQWPKWRGARK